jgi:hypothetical protein
MQLFTDSQKTRLFNSNEHITGLTEVQVNGFSGLLEVFTVSMSACRLVCLALVQYAS